MFMIMVETCAGGCIVVCFNRFFCLVHFCCLVLTFLLRLWIFCEDNESVIKWSNYQLCHSRKDINYFAFYYNKWYLLYLRYFTAYFWQQALLPSMSSWDLFQGQAKCYGMKNFSVKAQSFFCLFVSLSLSSLYRLLLPNLRKIRTLSISMQTSSLPS